MIHIDSDKKGVKATVSGTGAQIGFEFAVGLANVMRQFNESDAADFLAEIMLTAMEMAATGDKGGNTVTVDMKSLIKAMREMEEDDDSV